MEIRQNDMIALREALSENSRATESAMSEFFAKKSRAGSLALIMKAQEYSLMGGGKRIRPFLANEVCRMLGGDVKASMPFAIAVEMIHTYSLIHDDLPCMDDDDMRRGRPTNHKVFGEANAVLAGDALLTNAFLAAAENTQVSAETVATAIRLMSVAAGDEGMIGGQVTDIEGEGRELSLDELMTLHALKTGKMIELSAALGALAAGYGEDTREFSAVCAYARGIGLAFQVIDDLLDVLGDEETVGKTLASDAENNKTTFLTYYSIEDAYRYAEEITRKAMAELDGMKNTETLLALAVFLINRKS